MKNYFYKDLPVQNADGSFNSGKHDFAERWTDLQPRLELHREDKVLDVGCAEGLISLEISNLVQSVRAMELEEQRVEVAQKLKEQRGATNITFECGSILDTVLPEKSFDVSLFLSVYQQLPLGLRDEALRKILKATSRLSAVRTPLYEKTSNPLARFFGCKHSLRKTLEKTAAECGFTVEHYGPNAEAALSDSRVDHLFILKAKA